MLKHTGHWSLGVLIGALVSAGIAAIEEIFFLRRVRGKSTLETLITLSIAIIISDLIVVIWGGNPKMISIPQALRGFVSLFTVNIPIYNLFLFFFACLIGLALWLLINKTKDSRADL